METTVILVVACLLAGAGIGAWLVSLRPQTRPNTTPPPAPSQPSAIGSSPKQQGPKRSGWRTAPQPRPKRAGSPW